MQSLKWMLLLVACVFLLVLAVPADNPPVVAPVQKITFVSPMRVGGTLLPKGDYEVRHVMEGQDHIMVFHSVSSKKVAEVRVKCSLVPLPQKAERTETVYSINAAKEQVLQEMVFRGDTAKHVLE
jgi:hypothetical protein